MDSTNSDGRKMTEVSPLEICGIRSNRDKIKISIFEKDMLSKTNYGAILRPANKRSGSNKNFLFLGSHCRSHRWICRASILHPKSREIRAEEVQRNFYTRISFSAGPFLKASLNIAPHPHHENHGSQFPSQRRPLGSSGCAP